MKLHPLIPAFAVSVFGLTGITQAQLITGETATASSALGPTNTAFNRIPAYAVDDSGLTAGDNFALTPDQTHTDVPDFFMWLSGGTCCGSTQDFDPTFTVDLGALYGLSGMRVFNYNEGNGFAAGRFRGVNQTNVLISQDGVNYTSITPVTPLTIPIASGTPSETGTYFDLPTLAGGPVSARFVQFDILSNHGGDNAFYGLSELQFDAVPEPASAGLLAFAGLGLIARRRRG